MINWPGYGESLRESPDSAASYFRLPLRARLLEPSDFSPAKYRYGRRESVRTPAAGANAPFNARDPSCPVG